MTSTVLAAHGQQRSGLRGQGGLLGDCWQMLQVGDSGREGPEGSRELRLASQGEDREAASAAGSAVGG